jgi:hypothetical protein
VLTLQYIRIAFAAALQLTGAIKRFEGGPFVVVVNKVWGKQFGQRQIVENLGATDKACFQISTQMVRWIDSLQPTIFGRIAHRFFFDSN